jgi:hypothetical protein
MSDTFKAGNGGYQGAFGEEPRPNGGEDNEVGKALLVGLLGGLVSAAGYMVYRRLPDEQKERLHAQVRTVVAQRITELRQNFNI